MSNEMDEFIDALTGENDNKTAPMFENIFDRYIMGFEKYMERFGNDERGTASTTLLILKNIRPLIRLCDMHEDGVLTNSDILGRTLISVVLAFMLTLDSDKRMNIYEGVHMLLTAFMKGNTIIGVSGVSIDEILKELTNGPDTVGSC